MLDLFDLDDLESVVLPSDFEFKSDAGTFSDGGDLPFSSPGPIVHAEHHQASNVQQAIDQLRWHPQLCEDTTSSTASEAAAQPQAPLGQAAGAPSLKAAGKVQRRAEQNR